MEKTFENEAKAREDFVKTSERVHKASEGACILISLQNGELHLDSSSNIHKDALHQLIVVAAMAISEGRQAETMN